MFIQTETTPNPATLKFLPGKSVLPQGTLDLRSKEDAERSPLAATLFEIPEVSGVFFGQGITIVQANVSWARSTAGAARVAAPAVAAPVVKRRRRCIWGSPSTVLSAPVSRASYPFRPPA